MYRNQFLRCGETFRRPPPNLEVLDNTVISNRDTTLRPDDPLLNRPGGARIPLQEIRLYQDSLRKTLP